MADGSFASCLSAIERLSAAVEGETEAYLAGRHAAAGDFAGRKSLGLLELSRASRGVAGREEMTAVAGRLDDLREKLARNSTVLSLHLKAVGEVAAILTGAIRDAESDGTYGRRGGQFAERAYGGGA